MARPLPSPAIAAGDAFSALKRCVMDVMKRGGRNVSRSRSPAGDCGCRHLADNVVAFIGDVDIELALAMAGRDPEFKAWMLDRLDRLLTDPDDRALFGLPHQATPQA